MKKENNPKGLRIWKLSRTQIINDWMRKWNSKNIYFL